MAPAPYDALIRTALDGMVSPAQFQHQVEIAVVCIDIEGTDAAERLARSYGL